MLELVNIVKDYEMKDQEPVHALKGLSINFRRNEFVAILGPSGCGKTTLLNIIGGLDRYTTGDLIIEGKSTKNYKDGDWDTYRNHSIGFVFQSYNLIAHQTVARNVELALTIGGVDKEERRKRAYKALERVGLKGLEKKKPNQLSGGQMQRVAIARALINNPEILLADEPTGALDSETSLQIMDLLKEVAKDCLVIMVTHNPDLAFTYANRIVKMKDGVLLSDSAPFDGKETSKTNKRYGCPICKTVLVNKPDRCPTCNRKIIYKEKKKKASKGNKKNSSMSFVTATSLSFSNLLSKLKRTILIAVAGSIGIIGVSAVLAVSTGVHNYIDNMQNDMISQYPISVSEQAVDYTSLLTGLSNDDQRKIVDFAKEYEVGLDSLINYLMDKYKDLTAVKTNDINDDLLEYIDLMPKEYVSSINKNYGLDMTNNIFTNWQRRKTANYEMYSLNGLTQMYISELRTVEGFSDYAKFVDLFTDFMKEIPAEKDYILEQYDVLAGQYPESANDIVLVVDENQTLTDLIYAQMGFFCEDEFINIARKAILEHQDNPDPAEIAKYEYPTSYTFDEILNKKIRYYPHDSIWKYQTLSHDVLTFNTTLSSGGEDFDISFTMTYDSVMDALNGKILTKGYNIASNFYRDEGEVKNEEHPFYGRWVGTILNGTKIIIDVYDDHTVVLHLDSGLSYTVEANHVNFEIKNTIKVNENMTITSYSFDLDYASNALTGTITLKGKQKVGDTETDFSMPLAFNANRAVGSEDATNPYLGTYYGEIVISPYVPATPLYFSLLKNNKVSLNNNAENTNIGVENLTSYMYTAVAQDTWQGEDMHISAILKKKPGVNFGCLSRGVYYTRALTQKMMTQAKTSQIVAGEHSITDFIGSSYEQDKTYEAYVTYKYTSYAKGDGEKAIDNVEGYAMALNTDLSGSLSSMLSITGTSNYTLDKAYLRSLSGLATKEISTTPGTTTYQFKALPESIDIYPKDFTKKEDVTSYLKEWNKEGDLVYSNGKTVAKEKRHELTYTDTVAIIVAVINTLINVITIALVSFTSLALVVSCFMIAVITYISTMERVKEIGVIRSLGGRKKDVSRLFVAETLIIGLASGMIGIAVTYVIQLIINIIVTSLNVGITMIAALPLWVAGIMILLSIFLNVISGLIPAKSASNQDPVVALRSE